MRILLGDDWKDGHLDPHRGPGQLRISVRAFAPVLELDDVYFQPPRDLSRAWTYLFEVGPKRLFRKIVSRLSEGGRNQKFLSIGVGTVVETDPGSRLAAGDPVVFLAPIHPACLERVALAPELVRSAGAGLAAKYPDGPTIASFAPDLASVDSTRFAELGGYLPYSERPVDAELLDVLFASAERALEELDPARARALARSETAVREASPERAPRVPEGTLRAVLYGYGHYAKTNIIPNLPDAVRVSAVHELDPTQVGPVDELDFACDTSPSLRGDERYDVFFLAGYHHTHGPLASQAIRSGAYAVAEKPVVTQHDQLDELLGACRENPGHFYAGFHKRYSRFNPHTHADLDVQPGDPIHYYCIVYEVPLPARHWYHWPSARSRIVSNGCHWIDHFLYLNGYPEVAACATHGFPDGDIHCWAELANGASFSMVLTDKGSNRIGLEEYVELRTPDRKASIKNNGIYTAESRSRIVRRARVNKNLGYTTMYQTIATRIARGEPGDSLQSIERSSRLVLDLEDALHEEARALSRSVSARALKAPGR